MKDDRYSESEPLSPRLPLELLEHVLHLTDTATCATLSLVCRALVVPSRRRTFRRLRLHRLGSAKGIASFHSLGKLLESPLCTLAAHVDWLALDRPHIPKRGIEEHLQCLLQLPNLTTLRLDGREDDITSVLVDMGPFCARCPALTRLSLSHVGFVTFAEFASAMAAIPRLQVLSLYQIRMGFTDGVTPLPVPQDALGELRVLQCYMSDDCLAFQREFLSWMTALPRRPPLQHLEACPSWGDFGVSMISSGFLRGFAPTLETLTMRVAQRVNFSSTSGLELFDFTVFARVRSITINPVRLSWMRGISELGSRLLDFLNLSFQAPALRKVTISFVVDCDSEEPAAQIFEDCMDWKTLDEWAERPAHLDMVQFVLGGCSRQLELQGTYSALEERIRKVLPRIGKRGVLKITAPLPTLV